MLLIATRQEHYQKPKRLLAAIASLSFILLMSMIIFAESSAGTTGPDAVKIAQQPQTNTQDVKRTAAEHAFQQGMELYQQGTAESFQQAIAKFKIALQLWQTTGDIQQQAITLNEIGFIFNALGDKQQALVFFKQSLPLLRQVEDTAGEAVILNNIGGVYDVLGEKQQALLFYNQSLPLFRQAGDTAGEAIILNNIGGIYDALGDKQQALLFYNQSLPLFRQVEDQAGKAVILNNIGGVYDALGDKQQALLFYNQSLPLFRQVGDKAGEAIILNNIGGVYDALGDKQQALLFYNQSLPLRRRVGDQVGEATTLNNIGGVYDALGDKQQALLFYNQSLPLSRQVEDKAGEAVTLNNIGRVYSALGDKQQALFFYNQSLHLRRQVEDKAGEAVTLSNIASLERDRGNLKQAVTQIEAAIALIEDLRIKITNEQLRTSYFASQQDVYQFYIDLLMQLHKQHPSQGYDAMGWQASEKSRARSLLELLTEANADIRQGVELKLLEAERNLQQRIDTTEKRRLELYNNGKYTPEQAKTLENEFASLIKDYQDIQAHIRFSSPHYTALTQPQIPSVSEIQQQILDDDTLLLQYSLGEQRSYLWMVSKTSISSYELPKRSDIEILVKQFNYLLKIRSYSLRANREIGAESGLGAFRSSKVVAKLSQILLQPVADKLGNKRLLIVGDGALQYLPFAVLPEPDTVDKQIQPLIAKHEIISLPSASTLAMIRREHQGRKIPSKTLAIIADPVFSNNDDRLKAVVTQNLPITINPKFSFERLPFTRKEAEAILALIPQSQTLQALDFAANRAFVTSPQLGDYRIVHFATHGILDTENPALSGVVLSLFNEKGQVENGFLRLQDIFNLKLPAELIVLSACETGLGKEIKGEGLVGLTRGFMYAGSSRVLVSLWSVDDEATSELMKRFYTKIMKQKLTPAAALRAAQLELWQDVKYSAPYYWAAFTLQGEWK